MRKKKIAILGSSPVSLFEALYHARLGNDVVVIDGEKEIGGAWKTVSVSDQYQFELGCHIWDVDEKSYRFIEEFIGEKLEILSPTPTIIYKNMTFPYDWKHNPLVVKLMKQGSFASITRKRFVKPQIIPRKYKYPKGGSQQLIDGLKKAISTANIDLQLNTHVERIEINNDGCILVIDNEQVKFDNLVITSFANVKEISREGVALPLKHIEATFCNVHVLVKGESLKKLSYARILQHEFIHRVSDISNYTTNDFQVFCLGVFKERVKEKTAEEIIEGIKSMLVKHKWIDREAEIVDHFDNEYVGKYIDASYIQALEDLDKLTVLRSTNLIYCIANNVDRWEKVLLN